MHTVGMEVDLIARWRDFELCYRAASSRDQRFDGQFITAVRTTGIYCRPSCPAATPKRSNVEFLPTAAAAQQRGYRACKRCHPDASPGSPDWDRRADLVGRAMRLIADGVVDREGVCGLAGRLGYSPRQLSRLMVAELGAGPLALAREQRARTARVLIESNAMPMTEVAFAAGFSSVRQFNDTIKQVYAVAPMELRRARRADVEARVAPAGLVSMMLPAREPFDVAGLFTFLAIRAVPGLEHFDGHRLSRSLALPRGHGIVTLTPGMNGAGVGAQFRLADGRDLGPAVRRVRRWLDLDADPQAIDEVLGADARLAPSVMRNPGLRVPGTVDPVETAIRAVIGQQVSVAGARTVTGKLVAAVGERLTIADPFVTHVFPSPENLLAAPPEAFAMPAARRRTVTGVSAAVIEGRLVLDAGVDRADAARQLLQIPGIGPWTEQYIQMRALGEPDVFLTTDLGVRRVLGDSSTSVAEAWRPWRSYALHHVWALT